MHARPPARERWGGTVRWSHMSFESIEPLDLAELAEAARKHALESSQASGELQIVAFFDLVGSTRAKFIRGNLAASQDAFAFMSLASCICERLGGSVIKTMGDGVLATFPDTIAACRAALYLREATHEFLHLEMTAGLTSGRTLKIDLPGAQTDVLGDVVDRAARIQSLAFPGQVLLDGTLYNQVRADIVSQHDWQVDEEPRRAFAKGIGTLHLHELCLRGRWPLKKQLATPFAVIPNGRPTIEEKLALIRNAKSEILEIGIGLTSFAQYFTGQKPDEFRDPIRQMVRGGVDLKCFALDPSYAPGLAWLQEQHNRNYLTEADIARGRIQAESKHYRDSGYRGRLSYYTYRRVPEFWCLGVDVEDPLDGRMFFASYLMDVARSETPVVQVSRTTNAELFEKYLLSVRAVRAASTEG